MPFHIRKFKTGWRVYDNNGKSYSAKPLSKKTAAAQLRALYANVPDSKVFKGSGYCIMDKDIYLDGSGFFGDFFNKVKDVAKGVVNRVTGVTKGIRDGYSPKARGIIDKYGDYTITNIYIRRKPIVNMVDRFLNLISFGKLDKAKADLGYDKLFHLSMVLMMRPPNTQSGSGGAVYVLVEKNEVINIDTLSYKQVINQPFLQFGIPAGTSFRELMDLAQRSKGPDFFKYDAFNNNCQIFIAGILQANGLLSDKFKSFILQDTESILKQLPSYIKPFARGATDIAALANVAIEGQGMIKMTSKDFVAEHKKLVKLLNDNANSLSKEADKQSAELKDRMSGGAASPLARVALLNSTLNKKKKSYKENKEYLNFVKDELQDNIILAQRARGVNNIPTIYKLKAEIDKIEQYLQSTRDYIKQLEIEIENVQGLPNNKKFGAHYAFYEGYGATISTNMAAINSIRQNRTNPDIIAQIIMNMLNQYNAGGARTDAQLEAELDRIAGQLSFVDEDILDTAIDIVRGDDSDSDSRSTVSNASSTDIEPETRGGRAPDSGRNDGTRPVYVGEEPEEQPDFTIENAYTDYMNRLSEIRDHRGIISDEEFEARAMEVLDDVVFAGLTFNGLEAWAAEHGYPNNLLRFLEQSIDVWFELNPDSELEEMEGGAADSGRNEGTQPVYAGEEPQITPQEILNHVVVGISNIDRNMSDAEIEAQAMPMLDYLLSTNLTFDNLGDWAEQQGYPHAFLNYLSDLMYRWEELHMSGGKRCPKSGTMPCMCGGAEPLIDEGRLTELNKLILSKEAYAKKKPTGNYEDYVAKLKAANIKRSTRDVANEERAARLTKETEQNYANYKQAITDDPGSELMACKTNADGTPFKGNPMNNKMTARQCQENTNKMVDRLNEGQYSGPFGKIVKGLKGIADFVVDSGIATAVGVPSVATGAYKMFGPQDPFKHVDYSSKGSGKHETAVEIYTRMFGGADRTPPRPTGTRDVPAAPRRPARVPQPETPAQNEPLISEGLMPPVLAPAVPALTPLQQFLLNVVNRFEEIRGAHHIMTPNQMADMAFDVMDDVVDNGIPFNILRTFVNTNQFANNIRALINRTIDIYELDNAVGRPEGSSPVPEDDMVGGSFLSKLQSFALQIGIPAAAAGTAAVMTSDGGITLAATVVSTAATQMINQFMKMRRRRLPEDMRVEIESNIERLKKLLEDVEDKKDTLTENDYLKIMNELKDLYDETQAGYMVDMPSSISDSKLKGRERATRPIPALENRNTRTPAPARGSVAIPMVENPISRARGSGK